MAKVYEFGSGKVLDSGDGQDPEEQSNDTPEQTQPVLSLASEKGSRQPEPLADRLFVDAVKASRRVMEADAVVREKGPMADLGAKRELQQSLVEASDLTEKLGPADQYKIHRQAEDEYNAEHQEKVS